MNIHHISLLASNFTSNRAFYTQILGLRLVKDTVNQENPSIEHLFYGDYLGSPGTVITFFIVPMLGHRRDGNHAISGLTLQIPRASINWWANWLAAHQVETIQNDHRLTFEDPDQVRITLQEGDDTLNKDQIIPGSPVPGSNQIVKILGTDWIGPHPEDSAVFFDTFVGAPTDHHHLVRLTPDQFINLKTAASTERTRFGRGSIDHLALLVDDDDTLFDYWQRAIDQGWQLELYRNRHWFKSIYLRDPSDNRLELATPTPGFTIDEPLTHLGESLVLPPWLEKKRATIESRLFR